MPFLSFFADDQDGEILLNQLNADDDIAFLIEDKTYTGNGHRVKAVPTLDRFSCEIYSLWHIPSGELPLDLGKNTWVVDPWNGWITDRWSEDGKTPYLSNHFAEIRLHLWLRHQPYTEAELANPIRSSSYYIRDSDLLPVSEFLWIGDYFKPAPLETWRWWIQLTKWMSNHTIPIGEFELDNTSQTFSFWAFPSAFNKLKGGMAYAAKGHDLTEAIQNAGFDS
jgi:hypothetical protein